MLSGLLQYRRGDFELTFRTLRRAVDYEDRLCFSNPPSWMLPSRHTLGALYLEQGRVEDAERVFREDTGFADWHPRRRARLNNVWGLHGLGECLELAGKSEEEVYVKAALELTMASADVKIEASCYCRRSALSRDE
jgi:Flp pilus assembly protein TadD